ncbi:MAG: DUF3365 domain-containing protein [Bacteroidales bacterium]|nr:DUF3365 domain-containing protein [Bacteroidales bacterium]MCF8456557.1 DUF3365 domain-containing protein [Bacteroidales bacterium]
MKRSTAFIILIGLFFISCHQGDKGKNNFNSSPEITPLEFGNNIALKTMGILGKNLMHAINSEGTEQAISFCSSRAIPLTDSMALSFDAKIKRVSDRNRNPNNKASTVELDYINNSKEAISKGQTIKPKLITTENGYIGYYPIMTNGLCLKCHGQLNKDIAADLYSKIKQLYPQDSAIGYKEGELRGIWVIEMNNGKNIVN